MTKRITEDVTPTWLGILPLYLTALRGKKQGADAANKELRRMAEAADMWKNFVKGLDDKDKTLLAQIAKLTQEQKKALIYYIKEMYEKK